MDVEWNFDHFKIHSFLALPRAEDEDVKSITALLCFLFL